MRNTKITSEVTIQNQFKHPTRKYGNCDPNKTYLDKSLQLKLDFCTGTGDGL